MPYMHQDITNKNYKDTNLGRQEYVAWKKSIPLETLNNSTSLAEVTVQFNFY
jgi:hypothetical protein